MNAADTAWEAAHRAREAQRRTARLAREAALSGDSAVAQAIRDAWEPYWLFTQEMHRDGRHERPEPEGVIRND